MGKDQTTDRIKVVCLGDSRLRQMWFELTIAALNLRLAKTAIALLELRALSVTKEVAVKIPELEEAYRIAFLKLDEAMRTQTPDGLPLITYDDICNVYV